MNALLLTFFTLYSLAIIFDLWAEYKGYQDKEKDGRNYFEKYGRKLKRKQ